MSPEPSMDVDCEMEPVTIPTRFHPPALDADDVVRWQGSELSCPALEALMTESTPQHRKVCELFTVFFFTCHPVLTKFPALPEARSSLWNLAIPSPTYSSQSSST